MPDIRAILFDLDDTLIIRPAAVKKACDLLAAEVFSEASPLRQATFSRYLQFYNADGYISFDKNYEKMAADWPFPDPLPPLAPLKERYMKLYPSNATPKPEMWEVLRTLRQRGYLLGIVTNGSVPFQGTKLRALGIADQFESIVMTGAVGKEKPDRLPFQVCWEELGVPPEECAFVGDHPVNDMEGARLCGMTTVWIRGMIHWPEGQPGPDFMVPALRDILPLFPGR